MNENLPTCPRCRVEMRIGVGINPTTPDWLKRGLGMPDPYITYEDIRLDEVWKCPKCGHSQDILKDPRR